MHEIKIVGPLYPEKYLDEAGKEQTRSFYSFTVDGAPSLYWLPECRQPGLPPTYYIERTIKALRDGLSREAFGPAPEAKKGDEAQKAPELTPERLGQIEKVLLSTGTAPDKVAAILETIKKGNKGRGKVVEAAPVAGAKTVVSGGQQKPRAARPGWKYELDGKCCEQTYHSEAAAKSACAIAAFMTRGKLGAIPAALERLQAEFPDAECKVWACPKDHEVKASVDGKRYRIVWTQVAGEWTVEKFKAAEE